MASNHVSATQASINGLYLGVVLTIGNLFRSIFKDSSKRMIYEEVSDTDLLLDLCDGIYLARVQGNLHAEWMLYHEEIRPVGPWGPAWNEELIRIYRSPELLAHLSGKKGGVFRSSGFSGVFRSSDADMGTAASRVRWGIVAEHVRHANSDARE